MTQTQKINQHGLLDNNITILNPNRFNKKDNTITERDLKGLHNKAVEITMKDGGLIEGIVRETSKDKEIILAKDGNWDDRENVSIKDIEDINASEYPYYSLSYKRRLREQKKPRFEFRFSKEELSYFVGKYVSVNYDGKVIEGKVNDCKFIKSGENEIIIEAPPGEIKTIHDYRLRSIEITGLNYAESQGFQKIRDLEEELFIILEEEYTGGCPEGPDCKVNEPDALLEKYFESKLRIFKGEKVDLSGFNYNWIKEIVDQRDNYKNGSKVNDIFLEEVNRARDLNMYYDLRKTFIDVVFNKVRDVDWASYSINQSKGEIKALEYIYDSGLINR